MAEFDLAALNALPKSGQALALAVVNGQLETLSAEQRVAWALEHLPGEFVLVQFRHSGGGMSAPVTRIRPDIPVILIDTGYLFPETYRFIDQLTDQLKLNLQVFRAEQSPARQEARYGKLWEQGVEGIEKYNQINKVEPMNRALETLGHRAGSPACGASSPAAAPICRCWRCSAGCSRSCRSSTGTTARFTSI